MSEHMTGSQATIAQLIAEGVDVVLSIPGEHNIHLCDPILDHPALRFICGHHEQGITFMANGYARASGKIAVPLVITGPGVTNSITPLADAYQDSVPMVLVASQVDTHRLGKGAFHESREELARRFLEEADVVLVIGSSLDEASTHRWTLPLPENLIQIDTCPEMIGRNYPVAVGLVGDAKAVLAQLLEALADCENRARPSPAARIAEAKRKALTGVQDQLSWRFMNAIQQALPKDAFVTNDASLSNGWAVSFLQRYLPRTFNMTSNLAALGYAFAGAVGAKLAYPDRQAVAVVGDGGFLFTVYTLSTAVKYHLNAVAIVFNNGGYGSIRHMQMQRFGRTIGADLHNPDFVRLAEAYGAVGARATHPDQLYDALMAAWQRDVPTLIEVPLSASNN